MAPTTTASSSCGGCFIVQPETKQEFLLPAGTQDKMFGDGIARLEGILARLKEHKP